MDAVDRVDGMNDVIFDPGNLVVEIQTQLGYRGRLPLGER
jgi:hypothetical protein